MSKFSDLLIFFLCGCEEGLCEWGRYIDAVGACVRGLAMWRGGGAAARLALYVAAP